MTDLQPEVKYAVTCYNRLHELTGERKGTREAPGCVVVGLFKDSRQRVGF
jgi:hypothetical protein